MSESVNAALAAGERVLAALRKEHRIRSLHRGGGPNWANDLEQAEQEVLRLAVEYASLLEMQGNAGSEA